MNRGRFHAFRHAFCSWLANQGVSPFQVMKLMGHSSLDIVLTYYSVTEEELIRSVNSSGLDQLVGDEASDGKDTGECNDAGKQDAAEAA